MKARSRQRVRLLMRDLAGASAFASMAVSGELPAWSLAAFAAALAVALAGRRPLAAHSAVSAVLLMVVALGLAFSVVSGRMDLVIAASSFAGILAAQRMLAEPVAATDNQVHLTSLLMVAGGAALSGDLLFALCLTGFTVCIALSLGLGVVEGGARDDAELEVRPALRQIAVGATFAVLGGLIFFVLFPRLSWNLAGRRMGRGLAGPTAGLSTNIQLGATGGSIKTTARAVGRVRLSPDPGRESLDRYFVASHLTTFDGRSWDGPSQPGPQQERLNLSWEKPNLLVQEYELLPAYGQPIALALEHPATFMHAVTLRSSGSVPKTGFSVVPGREVRFAARGNGYSYTVWSTSKPSPATEEERLAALQLPKTLDPRVKGLAEQLAGNETNPERIASRIEEHLRTRFKYTRDLPGPVDDPLADFLFVRRAGHCEFFATALTVMLRTLNIPARVTVGFFGGARTGDHYVIRAGDAHAWTEVFIPQRGFLRFDATPEEGRRAQSATLAQLFTDAYERVESWWSRSVVDYSIIDQVSFLRDLFGGTSFSGGRAGQSGFSSKLPSTRRLFATVATGIVVFVLTRMLLSRGRKGRQHDATALLDAIEQCLRRARVDRGENEDIADTVKRLKASAHPLASDVDEATRRYLAARFGQRTLRDGELRHAVKKLESKVKARSWNAPASPP